MKDCYLNPNSQKFRRGLWNLRVAELKKKGKLVPAKMQMPEEPAAPPPAATPPAETPAAPEPKKDKALLALMGDDLQALLNAGMGYHDALEQAMEANLGLEFAEQTPDPMCVAFETGNMQALGGQDVHSMRAIIARHLRALKDFSPEDISAAAREIDQDDEPPGMDVDGADGEASDSDESDDDEDDDHIPLA